MPAPKLLIEPHTAHRCEDAQALHIRRQAEICQELYPNKNVLIQPVPKGGIAIRTLPAFRGKLNRAVGCGEEGELADADLKGLESVFATVGLEPEIHLSPFAQPSVFESLVSRGYIETGILSTYWCTLEQSAVEDTKACTTGAPVMARRATVDETEQFIEASATGFQTNGRSYELLRALALIANRRTDTTLYLAFANHEIAGTAAMATMETGSGGVAHLYLDSTLPGYRGRGVQLALIRARLLDAAWLGLGVATTITRVGDGSARNAERAGLRLAYTTAILTPPRG
ncbi:hypothetical protein PENDEC_c020G01231 [Penicillium decumbens]|uniref:N-acetyltransferase domain-containing protein n=1 Tax=Penicillium decumbens TaxID=69771 RepID=A0A1V6P6I6_PENDC|nr:hypothetical protein PENDEC_c020G01231 [Penicillium decumbens]